MSKAGQRWLLSTPEVLRLQRDFCVFAHGCVHALECVQQNGLGFINTINSRMVGNFRLRFEEMRSTRWKFPNVVAIFLRKVMGSRGHSPHLTFETIL